MNRLLLWLFLTFPLLSFADVFSEHRLTNNPRGYLLEIHGSNTIGAALAPALVEDWLSAHNFSNIETQNTGVENEKIVIGTSPNGVPIKIFIAAHGSGTGFKKIDAGEADIAAASRPAKASENGLFPNKDVTDHDSETVLAIDGIAVIVNPRLPLEALTIEQVGQLFSGKISNWNQIGGPNLPVHVHARDDKSGTYDTFSSLVLSRGYELSETAKRYESNDLLSEIVSSTSGAIGFTSLASINNAKALKIADGESAAMAPQQAVIATEDYPLARRLYLYQVNSTNPFAKDLLAYAKSENGQNVVSRIGFVSQNLSELPMRVQGEIPAGYAFITENSNRLTTNFRFRADSKELDNKALDDLLRLSEFMALPENQNRKLILIGFSNKQRDEFKARLQSEARVIKVKRELAKIGVNSSALTGYGEINPVASNQDVKYALRNRRVEVWIR